MLKNYFEIEEEVKIKNFLKEIKEKKNSHYIILNTNSQSFVDIRTIALKASNLNEKLKGLKKKLTTTQDNTPKNLLNLLIESGDRVIKSWDGYFDFIDALEEIINLSPSFLEQKIENIEKKEIYALNENDKISSARNLFLQKRINLLPVIKGLDVIGELRPIDFLVTDLFEQQEKTTTLYNEKYSDTLLNLPIGNIINPKPITIHNNNKIKELIQLMIHKHLPSVIITDENEKLYSIISYTDIFKLYKQDMQEPKYIIEYQGSSELYPEEFDLIQDFAERTMKKISNFSNYDNLKINFKTIGEKDTGHMKKIQIKTLLSHGNNIINAENEISPGTSDETYNDKNKQRWNIPLMAQETLDVLEKKAKQEKNKKG